MLKKRLVGTVLVKDGWAVQSFGYNRYFPLGKPECLVENLDRWGADEILVLSIDRSMSKLGPDWLLLEKLASLGLETPLIYGGGIHSVEEGVKVIEHCADRICIDSLLHNNLGIAKQLSEVLGAQAIVGFLPISYDGDIKWLDYQKKSSKLLEAEFVTKLSEIVSEFVVADWQNEGRKNGYDSRLISHFPDSAHSLISFGGISEKHQIIEALGNPRVAAVAIGNSLNYRENSIQSFKQTLASMPLRDAVYKTQYRILPNE